ncbi:MAG: hypothetical protein QM723_19785 [Myxococcaceae bacterium]
MGRVIAVIVMLGLAGTAAADVDCADQPEAITSVEVELALPAIAQASIPKPATLRWQTTVRDTGRELALSLFRPPIEA